MMKFDLKTVKSVTKGAVEIIYDNGFHFYRFTSEQEKQYERFHSNLLNKTHSTAGVCMEFSSNTDSIYLDVDFSEGSSRKHFSFDIFCNGKKISEISNFSSSDDLFKTDFKLENIKKNIVLPKGEKLIKIVFPWSVSAIINEIRIDEGSFVNPSPQKDIMLFFGDSITQGYDACYPSDTYVYRLSQLMNVDVYNKAIGGEVFFPELSEYTDGFFPKYISVAYGTNDWNRRTYKDFEKDCFAFYQKLSKAYPQSKIFALAPLWRKEVGEYREFGDFANVGKCIQKAAAEFENVFFINCYDFIPHEPDLYFADNRLHPNAKGFEIYSKKLFDSIIKCI